MIWPVSFLLFFITQARPYDRAFANQKLCETNHRRVFVEKSFILSFKRKTIVFILLLLYRYSSILARLYCIHKFPTMVRWRRRWVVWIGEEGQATKWWKYVIDFKRLLQPTFTVLDAIYAYYRYVLYPRVRVRAKHDVATQIGRRKFTVFPVKSADRSRLTIILKKKKNNN